MSNCSTPRSAASTPGNESASKTPAPAVPGRPSAPIHGAGTTVITDVAASLMVSREEGGAPSLMAGSASDDFKGGASGSGDDNKKISDKPATGHPSAGAEGSALSAPAPAGAGPPARADVALAPAMVGGGDGGEATGDEASKDGDDAVEAKPGAKAKAVQPEKEVNAAAASGNKGATAHQSAAVTEPVATDKNASTKGAEVNGSTGDDGKGCVSGGGGDSVTLDKGITRTATETGQEDKNMGGGGAPPVTANVDGGGFATPGKESASPESGAPSTHLAPPPSAGTDLTKDVTGADRDQGAHTSAGVELFRNLSRNNGLNGEWENIKGECHTLTPNKGIEVTQYNLHTFSARFFQSNFTDLHNHSLFIKSVSLQDFVKQLAKGHVKRGNFDVEVSGNRLLIEHLQGDPKKPVISKGKWVAGMHVVACYVGKKGVWGFFPAEIVNCFKRRDKSCQIKFLDEVNARPEHAWLTALYDPSEYFMTASQDDEEEESKALKALPLGVIQIHVDYPTEHNNNIEDCGWCEGGRNVFVSIKTLTVHHQCIDALDVEAKPSSLQPLDWPPLCTDHKIYAGGIKYDVPTEKWYVENRAGEKQYLSACTMTTNNALQHDEGEPDESITVEELADQVPNESQRAGKKRKVDVAHKANRKKKMKSHATTTRKRGIKIPCPASSETMPTSAALMRALLELRQKVNEIVNEPDEGEHPSVSRGEPTNTTLLAMIDSLKTKVDAIPMSSRRT